MNNKPSFLVTALNNILPQDKVVFLSQRQTPAKQLANPQQYQYIGGFSQKYLNTQKYKSTYQSNSTVPNLDKKRLNSGQNISGFNNLELQKRSGSHYQHIGKSEYVSSSKGVNAMEDMPTSTKQRYHKLTLRGDEFNCFVKKMYSPGKSSSFLILQDNQSPFGKPPSSVLSNGNSPTYQKNKLQQFDNNSLLFNLPRSQSQAKMITQQSENCEPVRKDTLIKSPISDVRLDLKKKSLKLKVGLQQSSPLKNSQSQLSFQQSERKNANNVSPRIIQNGYPNKQTSPQTIRSSPTITHMDSNPQSTKNSKNQSDLMRLNKLKQQQTTNHINQQILNSQFQDLRQKSQDMVKQISGTDIDKVLTQASPKRIQQNEEVASLDQYVTQVKIGQNSFRSQPTHKLKNNETNTQKLIEQLKQINQVIGINYKKEYESVKNELEKKSQQQQMKSTQPSRSLSIYYMSKMVFYQTQEFEPSKFAQIYRDHFVQSYHALGFCNVLAPQNPQIVISKTVHLARKPTLFNKTIVLDLDETLIHCNESAQIDSDVIIPIEFPNGEIINAGINVRPYVEYFLTQLTSLCEVIVFTASHSCYANKVIDHIDPTRKLIHHRLFRDSCVTTDEGVHIKDLRIIGDRDLKDLVLVDNAAYSYGFQIDNGIPIIPYYDNKKDTELLDLLIYIKSLLKVPDVRTINRETFRIHKYCESSTLEDALYNICSDQI